jgi:hypothetical protein
METHERRKHSRCHEDTEILYSYLNKTETHAATARNYSRFGMYLESDTALSPGTIIVIRTLGCKAASDLNADDPEKSPATFYCKGAGLTPGPCRELKSMVTAEVKRCEMIPNAGEPRYGIGVHFVEPAV